MAHALARADIPDPSPIPGPPPGLPPAHLEFHEKANCYTPKEGGTDCSTQIPETPEAEDPIRANAIHSQVGCQVKIIGSV
ncbi:predicted protein [Pyrenophora tritici-repentis Pt-1C-BFP]|uniref:Uncharacterized protein n=1 Tax=Pyrenophora tritici-repentis (strain Pt-1C-BFP) TaxID=426418 RepID=B2W489_PYRTR|nr:uncharacterized protein PTRG_05289 [Pyrenophora tritici-repentis Pt-1C-BFP]EDU48196.1 predicted protein [Pyrenophora tritici-repentis Pt-1C-BFP]